MNDAPEALHTPTWKCLKGAGFPLGAWTLSHVRKHRADIESSGCAALMCMKNPECRDEGHLDLGTARDMSPPRLAVFPTIVRSPAVRVSPQHARSLREHGLRCGLYGAVGAVVALLAWYPGHLLIALVVLPFIWSATCNRWSALSLWGGYYLAGARDLPRVCERFFSGYGELSVSAALALGVAFWLGQALLLAAPWALLTPRDRATPRAWRAMFAIVLVSVPPLGIIGWLSPIHVAGALYPGWQAPGLLLGVCVLATAAHGRHSRATLFAGAVLMGLAMIAHLVVPDVGVPAGWVAVDTSFGRLDQSDYAALYARTEMAKEAAQRAFETGMKVVVLPEELVGTWRPATQYWWRDYLQQLAANDRTLILGVDVVESVASFGAPASGGDLLRYTDSAMVVGAVRGRFDSRQPVPAGLWRPGAAVSATLGNVTQPYLAIAGRRAAFSICYEDFLWWPHWRLLTDRPDVLVGMSNGWFSAGLDLAHIQQQSVQSTAQLAGVPLLRAANR
jgi:apolipoprotein N-acyltransferase